MSRKLVEDIHALKYKTLSARAMSPTLVFGSPSNEVSSSLWNGLVHKLRQACRGLLQNTTYPNHFRHAPLFWIWPRHAVFTCIFGRAPRFMLPAFGASHARNFLVYTPSPFVIRQAVCECTQTWLKWVKEYVFTKVIPNRPLFNKPKHVYSPPDHKKTLWTSVLSKRNAYCCNA